MTSDVRNNLHSKPEMSGSSGRGSRARASGVRVRCAISAAIVLPTRRGRAGGDAAVRVPQSKLAWWWCPGAGAVAYGTGRCRWNGPPYGRPGTRSRQVKAAAAILGGGAASRPMIS
jgi:hypothetical protein